MKIMLRNLDDFNICTHLKKICNTFTKDLKYIFFHFKNRKLLKKICNTFVKDLINIPKQKSKHHYDNASHSNVNHDGV